MQDSLVTLPPELFLTICCHLDPASLEALASTSRYCRSLVYDETAWKLAFQERFGQLTKFSDLERTWKGEYTMRAALLRKYVRGRGKNILFDAKIGNISQIFVDPLSSRVLSANISNGLGSTADTHTGKVEKEIFFPAATRSTSGDITSIKPCRHGMVYGFNNGCVAINLLSKSGTGSTSFAPLTGWHSGPVSALCVVESKVAQDRVTLLSGSMDGSIIFWNYNDPAQHRLAEVKVSPDPILSMSWDPTKNQIFVLTGCAIYLVSYQGMDRISVERLAHWPNDSAVSELQMICDHRASVAFVARGAQLYRYCVGQSVQESELRHGLSGTIAKIAIDSTDHEVDPARPGSGGRLMCIADNATPANLVVFNCRSVEFTAICCITIQNVLLTSLALNSTVLAYGCADGSVILHDLLTGQNLRPANNRIVKYERIAEEDPARTAVACIYLRERHPSGVIAIGGQIKVFDYDPRNDRENGKRKGLSRRRNGNNLIPTTMNGRALVQDVIREDMLEMSETRSKDEKYQKKLQRLGGDLANDLTEPELLSYLALISQDGSEYPEHSSGIKSTSADLEEAIRRSLQSVSATDSVDVDNSSSLQSPGCGLSSQDAVLNDEDYQLALALSASLATSQDQTQ